MGAGIESSINVRARVTLLSGGPVQRSQIGALNTRLVAYLHLPKIAALQNSENCDPPCGAPVSGVLPLGYTRVALFVANEGHTAPSTGDALLDQALGSR